MLFFQCAVRFAQRLGFVQLRRQQRLQIVDIVGKFGTVKHGHYFTKRAAFSPYGMSGKPNKYAPFGAYLRSKPGSVCGCASGGANQYLQAALTAALASNVPRPLRRRANRHDPVRSDEHTSELQTLMRIQ